MTAKKIHANMIHCESLKNAINYDTRTQKEILFSFPFIDNGVIGPAAKFSWDGTVKNIDAYCNKPGEENTVIDIEIISDEDFKNGNDSWHSIFASDKKLVIDANNIVQNSSYEAENIDIKKNSLFRVNFLETGKKSIIDNTRIQGLTVQINIDIKD